MTCHVTFLPDGLSIDVPEGTMISDAAVKAGAVIKLPCGGRGRCGRCTAMVWEWTGPSRITKRS